MKIFYDNKPLFDFDFGPRSKTVIDLNLNHDFLNREKPETWQNPEKSFAKLVARAIVEGRPHQGTIRGWIDWDVFITNIEKPEDQKFDETKLRIEE